MPLKARVLGVIPARLGSTRLPRKPLHLLAGRPLLEWVWRRATSSRIFDEVVIATDSGDVADVARGFGAAVAMTREDHPSGTDRVAEVVGLPAYTDYTLIVNVQGDEPFVATDQIAEAVRLVESGWPIGTVAASLESVEDWLSPSVVKVVRATDGGALLFTRAPVPHVRDGGPTAADLASGAFLRHIGIYAYSRLALERWVALPEAPLERFERLEQLRPLSAGIRIGVAQVAPAEPGVDTLEDAQRAEAKLLASGA